jgi:hypothetical protein
MSFGLPDHSVDEMACCTEMSFEWYIAVSAGNSPSALGWRSYRIGIDPRGPSLRV